MFYMYITMTINSAIVKINPKEFAPVWFEYDLHSLLKNHGNIHCAKQHAFKLVGSPRSCFIFIVFIAIWQYPKKQSMNKYISWPAISSTFFSIFGSG